MMMIVDARSNKVFDVNEYWKGVCVNDSTNYVERANCRTFTTLSPRGSTFIDRDTWEDFWLKKDHANTELLIFAAQGQASRVRDLISPLTAPEEQAELLFSNSSGLNALHVAVKHNRELVVSTLLETDKSILSSPTFNEDRFTALHIAVRGRRLPMAQLLIREYHADVDAIDGHGSTPLHYAAMTGDV